MAGISPLRLERLDESLRLAVGLGPIDLVHLAFSPNTVQHEVDTFYCTALAPEIVNSGQEELGSVSV
jgi:hypothetical protein